MKNRIILWPFLLVLLMQVALGNDCNQNLDYLIANYHAQGIHQLNSVPTQVPRYGKYHPYQSKAYLTGLYEVEISKLRSIHPIPNPYREGSSEKLESIYKVLQNEGFNLLHPIQVGVMPDGTLRILGGHHRVKAMQMLGDSTIPAEVIIWDDLGQSTKKMYKEAFFDEYKKVYPELYPELLADPTIYD